MGVGEATNPEKMEALYDSIRTCGTEEQDNTPFPSCKVVYEYQDTVDLTSLSDEFAALFPEEEILLNACVEWTVMINNTTNEQK